MASYFNNRDENIRHAKAWFDFVSRNYRAYTQKAIIDTKHYDIQDYMSIKDNVNGKYDTKVLFDQMTSVDAIEKYHTDDKRICVLNFASYKHPGGMFIQGSMAQEESLCHKSNLYNVLCEKKSVFYNANLNRLNYGLYDDNLLYSKDIVFDIKPNLITCDVITCAAPNKRAIRQYRSNDMNLTDDVINDAMKNRLRSIMYAAYNENAQILILGAFGCGVFGNNPKDVGCIMSNLISMEFNNCFERIIIAIPDISNYNLFLYGWSYR